MKTHTALLIATFLAGINSPGQTIFSQITNSDLVSDTGNWVGCAWGDFRNVGSMDCIAANLFGTNSYCQNSHGAFLRISGQDPVQGANHAVNALAADYDNDGNLDLAITAGAFYALSHNQLYHGNGDGTFAQASGGGITNLAAYFGPGAWGDYDNDGYVDLIVLNHGIANANGGANVLYHNNGDGTFNRITTGAIVTDFISTGFSATWEDYDNDGLQDLLVINYATGRNFLYHNNGNGNFSRVSTNIVATDFWSQGAVCAAWGDYDNDGLPDLFVTDGAGARNQLYHNSGKGVFTRVASGPELIPAPGGGPSGCAWGDYDNDGYLDLFVSGFQETSALFHNNGDGTFEKIASDPSVTGGGPHMVCGAVSWVDYDQDGSLDLFVCLADATNEPSFYPGKSLLYHNNGNTNAWLEVRLTGTVANRSGIGAKVRAHATIGGKSFWQLREIGNGGGYNCPPLLAHFGLGDATNVDALRIEWPSGTVQELHNIAPRQILTITEPPRLLASVSKGVPQFILKAWPRMQFDVQSSADLANWSTFGSLTVTNLNGLASIVDTNAPSSDQRFYRAVTR